MRKPAMAFSASIIADGLATHWIMNHSMPGFTLDTAAITPLLLAGIFSVVAMITSLMLRHTEETSSQAIERQMIQRRNRAA